MDDWRRDVSVEPLLHPDAERLEAGVRIVAERLQAPADLPLVVRLRARVRGLRPARDRKHDVERAALAGGQHEGGCDREGLLERLLRLAHGRRELVLAPRAGRVLARGDALLREEVDEHALGLHLASGGDDRDADVHALAGEDRLEGVRDAHLRRAAGHRLRRALQLVEDAHGNRRTDDAWTSRKYLAR